MLSEIFGDLLHKDDLLTDGQITARAFVTFLLTIALVRLAGRRSFGMRSPLDTVISLLLGATLSRGIVGATSFTGTLEACILLTVMHRVLAYISIHSQVVSRIVSGKGEVLYANEQHITDKMNAMLVSEEDVLESVRSEVNEVNLNNVKEVVIERNGQISVVKKS